MSEMIANITAIAETSKDKRRIKVMIALSILIWVIVLIILLNWQSTTQSAMQSITIR